MYTLFCSVISTELFGSNTSPLCLRSSSEPSFGHFNKDDVLDVVVEEDIGNYTKRVRPPRGFCHAATNPRVPHSLHCCPCVLQVMILDGKSGGLLWEVNLLASPNSPRPAAIHTINSFSIFVFWGTMPSQANSSVSTLSLLKDARWRIRTKSLSD